MSREAFSDFLRDVRSRLSEEIKNEDDYGPEEVELFRQLLDLASFTHGTIDGKKHRNRNKNVSTP